MNPELFAKLQDPIDFKDFMGIELRIGTVLEVSLNSKARKPAYILKIDFGPFGIKTSSAQITKNYETNDLEGRQVVAVMNFLPKLIAGIKSEVLVLGAYSESKDVVLLQLTHNIENGSRVA
jgi:tRNA-binding protein